MRYTLRLNGITVGRSALEHRDRVRSTARGAFSPGPGYDLVEPIFALLAEASASGSGDAPDAVLLSRFEKARSKLRFEVVDAAGQAIVAHDVVVRAPSINGERGEIEVRLEDGPFWST